MMITVTAVVYAVLIAPTETLLGFALDTNPSSTLSSRSPSSESSRSRGRAAVSRGGHWAAQC